MKYNKKIFYNEVKYYADRLKGKAENKLTFIIVDINNEDAFYSIAPLSRAIHSLNCDLHVVVVDKKSGGLETLKDIWYVYEELNRNIKTKKTKALGGFIKSVNKKTKKTIFKEIFIKPEIMLKSGKKGFKGTLDLSYQTRWHKKYRWSKLLETTTRIWKEGYNLKKGEKVSVGFVLIPSEKHTELPLEDYLDSYSVARAFSISAKKIGVNVGMGSTTDRHSLLARSVRSADLMATIKGCQLDKDIDEEVFLKFKILSKYIKADRIEFPTASFGIHAKGYFGKHFFGEEIGYPSSNKKTRWSSPGQLMLKDPYSPQTALEPRDPMMRYAITETLPIDIFIETCNVSYADLRKRSFKIKNILSRCDFVRVIGEQVDGHKTDFTVGLVKKDGTRKEFIASDSDVREIIDEAYYKKTKIKAGTYANFPSGEAFITPASMKGTMVGDVVINIDRSYVIPKNNPIIVSFNEKGYKIIKAPKSIWDAMKKEKSEAWQKIKDYEKSKSLPKEVIDIYKRNFNLVGEFAINTNPKAKLCDYLIVNEKIAKMIHVALGLGFEPDRKTTYHWDIVIDSPKQKLDIYGLDKSKKVCWILKKGKFVI